MSDSLKDQLMQLGFQPKVEPRRDDTARNRSPGGPRHGKHGAGERGARGAGGQGGKPGARGPGTPGQGDHASAPDAAGRGRRGRGAGHGQPAAKRDGEMDLAQAYALRQRQEQAERAREEHARQEEARLRREARQKLAQLLEGKAQNQADAELARHFEFGGKIRRVHVTEAQFKAVNAGELGVVQLAGRYLLVDAGIAREAAAIVPGSLALLVDPGAVEGGDDYADPRYQVPDDIVW